MTDVVVVGGGAAGLMAALFAARAGARVTLLERNEKLGKKLYITGKGRCNLTNTAPMEEFMRNIPRNPRFMYAALAFLSNEGTIALIESLGVPVKVERGNRAYPRSDRASDVTRCLERALNAQGVRVMLNARVESLLLDQGAARGIVLTDGARVEARAVIVATGGLSYASTGSTGDGYALARQAGLSVTATRPALVGIETQEDWPTRLTGLTLKNVRLSASQGKKRLFNEMGELLFTHFGLSGPLVLSMSSVLPDDPNGQLLSLDLKPALDHQTLDARIVSEVQAAPRKQLGYIMDQLAPHSLAAELLPIAGLSAGMSAHALTQANRARLVDTLKNVPVTVRGYRGYGEAVITRGGVDVKGINPSTMQSRAVPGLYFAGEVIDIDAMTGGYNLQLAFSTGALAGARAAEALRSFNVDPA